MKTERNWYVYILKLELDCWYVGTSKNLIERLNAHASKSPHSLITTDRNKKLSTEGLTGKRKAVSINNAFTVTCNSKVLTDIENTITAILAKKYGYGLVRGGTWFQAWDSCHQSKQAQKHAIDYCANEDSLNNYQLKEVDLKQDANQLPLKVSSYKIANVKCMDINASKKNKMSFGCDPKTVERLRDGHMQVIDLMHQLQALTHLETDEVKIFKKGEELLSKLRKMWRINKNNFSTDDVLELKKLSKIITSISEFIEEKDEFPYLKTQEDVEEVLSNLFQIIELTDGLNISKRILKETRELTVKQKTLPMQLDQKSNSMRLAAIRSLSSNAPDCKKCGRLMILREGNGSFFWGCSTFPDCWSRRKINAEELDKLP